jgi:hypothetical protein
VCRLQALMFVQVIRPASRAGTSTIELRDNGGAEPCGIRILLSGA